MELLEGKTVNLKEAEEKDVSLVVRWWKDPQYMGKYQETVTMSLASLRKVMFKNTLFFIIQKKDGPRVGHVNAFMIGRTMEVGFALVPSERRKGYGAEAIQLIVDHLFPTKDIARIQASTDIENVASQKALEKCGFVKEGIMRKSWFVREEYRDHCLYSILKEEWKRPRILKKTS